MNQSILQDWVINLPLKMQTVLCLGTRGPDNYKSLYIKKLTRWIRGQVYKPADPDNPSFMLDKIPEPIVKKTDEIKDLEFVTVHFFTHLMHTLEITGYKHPDEKIRESAYLYYVSLVKFLHLNIENETELDIRLGLKQWPNGQPKNFLQAIKQMENIKNDQQKQEDY